MKSLEKLIAEINTIDLINGEVEPKVGSCLLRKGNNFQVIVYITHCDMLGNSHRIRKSITINEPSENKAHKKRGEIEDIVKAAVYKNYISLSKHDLVESMERWLNSLEVSNKLELTTISNYKDKFKLVKAYFATHPLCVEDVTTADINAFCSWAVDSGRVNPIKREDGYLDYGLSIRTVKDVHGILFGFFKYACNTKEYNISINPCRETSLPHVKQQDTKSVDELWMDNEQYKKFRQWLFDNTKEYKYRHLEKLIEICELLIYSGMRREELAGLRWNNVNLQEGFLTVCRTRTRAGTIEVDKARCKNVDSNRTYPLTASLIDMFEKMKQRQIEAKVYKSDGFIYIWEYDEINHNIKAGTPYKVDYLTKLFKKAVTACPYVSSNLTLHKMRHSTCSIAFMLGWSEKKVQEWLGHKEDSTITRLVYNHYRQYVEADDVEKLDAILK